MVVRPTGGCVLLIATARAISALWPVVGVRPVTTRAALVVFWLLAVFSARSALSERSELMFMKE